MSSDTVPSVSPRPGPALWPVLAVVGLLLALWRVTPTDQAAVPMPVAAGPATAPPAAAPDADPHGRQADTPTEIPPRGWLDIAKRVWTEIGDDRLVAVAAGVTFYALLALFPAIAAFVSLYGLFADAGTITTQLDNLKGILPEGGLSIIGDQVRAITAKPAGSLGFATVIGLLISLWSANAGMKAMFDALNVAYNEKEQRSFVKLNLISLSFTIGAIVLLIAAMGVVVVVPVVLKFVGLDGLGTQLIALARWPVLLVVIALALAVLYRFGPSRPKAKWRWITWGSAFAAVAWVVASLGFSFYVSHFGSYNATYGSLGAMIGFLTWMWISSIVVLLGAEISSEMEHQTAQDTTEGPEKPLGARGARMADEVGIAR